MRPIPDVRRLILAVFVLGVATGAGLERIALALL